MSGHSIAGFPPTLSGLRRISQGHGRSALSPGRTKINTLVISNGWNILWTFSEQIERRQNNQAMARAGYDLACR